MLIKSTTLYEHFHISIRQTPYLWALSALLVGEYIIENRFLSTKFSTKIAQFSFSFSQFHFLILYLNPDLHTAPENGIIKSLQTRSDDNDKSKQITKMDTGDGQEGLTATQEYLKMHYVARYEQRHPKLADQFI